jgi:3-oxoadipate enol-lactonase
VTISYELYEAAPESSYLKPPVVLVNGLADTKETWVRQIPALVAAGYTVLAFDNRGIGASSRPTEFPYTAELLASDTKALVEALSLPKPFHLVGVSMGGMIAQSYALTYPNDTASLILACTYAKPSKFCSKIFEFWADVAKAMSISAVMKDVCSRAFTLAFFEPEQAREFQELDDSLAQFDEELTVAEYLCQLNVIQVFDSTEKLHRLTAGRLKNNVMVLVGEEDVLIPTSLSKELQRLIEGSRWREVRGGHACLWEFPTIFNEAVIEWLDEHSG